MNGISKNSDGIRRRAVSGDVIIYQEKKEEVRAHSPLDSGRAKEKENDYSLIETENSSIDDGASDENAILTIDASKEKYRGGAENAKARDSIIAGMKQVVGPVRDRFVAARLAPVWWSIIMGGGGILFVLVLLSTVFVRMTVAVKPRIEELAIAGIEVSLEASETAAGRGGERLPAELLTFSRTATEEFEATGAGSGSGRSRGMVKIYNNFSAEPQKLIAHTRLATEGGAVYRLLNAVTVPGAKTVKRVLVPQSAEAEAIAENPGESGNISGEIKLSIPGFKGTPRYEKFYAVAPAGFSGGWKGQARVVSKDDRAHGEEAVTKRVFGELGEEMARKLPPDFTLLEGLREIQIADVKAPAVNTRFDRFSVRADAVGKAIVFRARDLIALLEKNLIPSEDATIVRETFAPQFRIASVDFSKGTARLILDGTVRTRSIVSEKDLIELAKGKNEAALIEALRARTDLATFQLKFFPPWNSKAPSREDKIRVVVQE